MITNILNTLLIFSLVIFSLSDCVTTMYLVYGEYARELNPILKHALDIGPWAFIFAKIVFTTISTVIFWALKEEKITTPLLLLLNYIYLTEVLYQYKIICNI